MRKTLQYILKILAKMILWRHKPEIVAVSGSVGKSSAKEAIYQVLQTKFRARRNLGNYNNEIGVPLTILGQDSSPETTFSCLFAWLKIFLKALGTILWQRDYPEILILELAVSHPGDMKYLLGFVPAKIGVFTAIGEFPSHIEFFPEKERLIKEKALLLKSLPKNGLAVLNYDDLSVRMVGDELPEEIKTAYYGFGQGADLKISNFQFLISDLAKGDFGINFKLEYQGNVVPFRLSRVLGKQQSFAIAAAAAIGIFFGLNLVEISESVRNYQTLPGRTNLIRGIKNAWIIDDSYNASPLAAVEALEILEETARQARGRKIAVLGDMLELGEMTKKGHQTVGGKAAKTADLLFTVGEKSQFTADEAELEGLEHNRVFRFSNSWEAGQAVRNILESGDIVLVKGSRAVHMEKIVEQISEPGQSSN